jgi:hypothetical protein
MTPKTPVKKLTNKSMSKTHFSMQTGPDDKKLIAIPEGFLQMTNLTSIEG